MAIIPNLNSFGAALRAVSTTGVTTFSQLGVSISGLSKAQLANLLITNNQKLGTEALNVQLMYRRLREAGVTKEVARAAVTQVAHTQATKGQIAANTGLNFSFVALKNTAKGLWATLWASPLFKIALAAAAIYGVIKLVNHFTTTLKEQQEIVSNLKDELSSLQSEYDQLLAKDNRTDAEERRLELLKAQLDVKKELLAIEGKKEEKKTFTEDSVVYDEMGNATEVMGSVGRAYRDVDRYKESGKALAEYNAEIEKYSNLEGLSEAEIRKVNKKFDSSRPTSFTSKAGLKQTSFKTTLQATEGDKQ